MQFKGGYRYPDLVGIFTVTAALLALAVLGGAWYAGQPLSGARTAALACGLVGTAFLGAAFSPVGLLPPPRGLRARLVCFFAPPDAGVSVAFTQWAFYAGLLLLATAAVVSVFA